MVTRIRSKGVKPHLYIVEWMSDRGLSDQTLGERMEVSRQTVYRWRTQQHRLNPGKQAAIAAALGLEAADLWRPPGPRSIDAMLKEATPEEVGNTVDFVERYILKRAQ